MLRKISSAAACVLVTTPAFAGGWETGRLGTGFLFEDGNYVELSYGSLNYSVNGTTQAGVTHPMAKDQTRAALSGKFQLGDLHVGVTSFGSGAIQMDGQAAGAGSVVPSANVDLNTRAILGRYSISDNFSIIAGVREAQLSPSTVTTSGTTYSLNSASKSGLIYGVAYELPEIALRLEVVRSEEMTIGLSGTTLGFGPIGTNSTLGIPAATTVNFQTGIAEDTLLIASAHMVEWKPSQVSVTVPAFAPLNVGSDFSDTTAYSLGIGRRLAENTSGSVTYSWEEGAGSTSTSPFTMSNGSKTLSIGLSHNIDALAISGGLNYTQVGDVRVTHSSGATANYANNHVTGFGVKIGYRF